MALPILLDRALQRLRDDWPLIVEAQTQLSPLLMKRGSVENPIQVADEPDDKNIK